MLFPHSIVKDKVCLIPFGNFSNRNFSTEKDFCWIEWQREKPSKYHQSPFNGIQFKTFIIWGGINNKNHLLLLPVCSHHCYENKSRPVSWLRIRLYSGSRFKVQRFYWQFWKYTATFYFPSLSRGQSYKTFRRLFRRLTPLTWLS